MSTSDATGRPRRRRHRRNENPHSVTDAIHRLDSRMRRLQRSRNGLTRRWRLSEAELRNLVEETEHFDLVEG